MIDALLAMVRRKPQEAPPVPVVSVFPWRGFAYVCRRCDVFGVIGDVPACWACEESDRLEKR